MYYKNVKQTFEILRSEITFLMDLYSSLNTLSMILHILFAPNTTMASIVMTEIQTNVNALCSLRRDISLCMILRHAIILKELEHD